ncbi:hypothetical protein [Streptomyces sp. CT34]|uniref:hypothetical protein n=1 Tax=Streptomyces sp. CT34 TaxID=1553907 RepID=UPI0005BE419F|nr:hypothetical protein [Streptomyces sp. CT34]
MPLKILRGDGPRMAWYAHLVAAVDRIGDLKGWTGDVRDSAALTLDAVVALHEAGTPVYSASPSPALATEAIATSCEVVIVEVPADHPLRYRP